MLARWLISALPTLLLSLLASTASADVTGSILGVVTDSSGASIARAMVKLSNADTGLQRTTTTNEMGAFEFLAVPASTHYSILVEAPSFRQSVQSDLTLQVDQRLRVDVKLEVGAVAETVNVSGQAVQVETTSTQLGDVINDTKMTALPLNGRSYLDLLGLQAGVSPTNTTGNGQPVSGNLKTGQVSVNGQRENANAFMVNGGTVEDRGSNGASIVPTLDSIQEFRLLTNSFDAEYGHFSGAVVNAITKSGTNSIHGDVFEFLRNEKLDARNFFDGSDKGTFRRNQFGYAVGGPILKNRLFFFSDYQGTRESRGLTSAIVAVPSTQERSGDFSDVGTTGFAPLTGTVRGDSSAGAMAAVLSKRLGYTVNPGEPYWVAGCNSAAAAQIGMCVFPNQVIPQRAFSPAAAGTLKFIPMPVGVSGGQPYFSTSGLATTVRDDKIGERVTLDTKGTGNWSFYYHFDDATVDNPFGQSTVPGFASELPSRAQQANMSNTKIFGPTAVNELRLNYVRVAYPGNVPTQGLGKVSSFGFTEGGLGLIPANGAIEGVPQIQLNQLGVNFGSGVTDGNYQIPMNSRMGFRK